jgi:hypothetical protein
MQKLAAQKFCCLRPKRTAMQHGHLGWTTPHPPAFRNYQRGFNSAFATFAIAHGSLLRATGRCRRSYWLTQRFGRMRTMPVSIAPAIRTSVDFQLQKKCLPTALGCHFPQAATSVRRRF